MMWSWSRSRIPSSRSSIILLLSFFIISCHAQSTSPVCVPSSCGNIKNITFPFRLKGDPRNCGNPNFELDCQNNRTVLHLNSRNYYVQSIDYERFSIRVVDSALESNNSCSFPLNSREENISDDIYRGYSDSNFPLAFIQCLNPVNSSQYVDISFCNPSKNYRYIVVGNELTLADLEVYCSVDTVIRSARLYQNPTVESSLTSIHEALVYGFELSWIYSLCSDCYGHGDCIIESNSNSVICRPYTICYEHVPLSELAFHCRLLYWAPFIIVYGGIAIGGILGLRFLLGFSCLIGLLVYKCWKSKNLSKHEHIGDTHIFEELKKNFNHIIPIRYSYSEIKKMTGNFKERIGRGRNGTVYKGKLRSGPPIVVKIIEKSMFRAQEFADLITSMAKIKHDNLLQLIGFCIEAGGKQAFLVYDLMPNGSIQKYLSAYGSGEEEEEEENPLQSLLLSYQKIHQISVEVARGIDHLHQNFGINQRSHLGFKPHNVLLDENMNPKISAFGDVKLSVGRISGGMAPEFFYNNIGEVSHKADVYSYGILLMEMLGKRKMLLRNAINGDNDEEIKVLKKIIMVGLWCIQMLPEERPSMDEVVEVLEGGDTQLFKMPPTLTLTQKMY